MAASTADGITFIFYSLSLFCREYAEMTSVRYVDFDRPTALLAMKGKAIHHTPQLSSMEVQQ